MIVTELDLGSERLALLPAGWQQDGTPQAALQLFRRRWKNQMANHRTMRTLPSGLGMAVGADSERGVFYEAVPLGWSDGQLIFDTVDGFQHGRVKRRPVEADFDIVELRSGQVLAEVRKKAAGDAAAKVSR